MKKTLQRTAVLAILLVMLHDTFIFAQSGDTDLNEYYYYPASTGVYYHQMSGIGNKDLADFNINEISAEVRVPIPGLPVIQPLLRGGYLDYSYTGDIDVMKQDWSHYYIFGGIGAAYCSRISREFEVGAELFLALSQSYFSKLYFNGTLQETSGQLNILTGLSGRLALNPSYNISISANPSLNFSYGLGPLNDYDGFTLGIGFSGTYRFGNDPDASGATIKALRFDQTNLPPLFAAMQSYYVKNRAGTFTITNKEKYSLDGISLSFMQPGFMDSPTPIASDIVLGSGESVKLPLYIAYNNEVFSTQGVTPLTGEITASYTVRGREIEQRQSVTYDLHDRNALTWNDDRKAAAFVTSQDSAVRNYASHIRQIHREAVREYVSGNLQYAMQVFNALAEIGIIYQIDPTAPFAEMQGDTYVVDSVSLPRETLKRLTGDCDDLSVLFCTMLESVGVDSALVTIPGHIFIAFDTGVPSPDYRMIDPSRSRIIETGGSIWIPVEITMIGRNSFTEAWSTGYAEYSRYDGAPDKRGFYKIGEAQQIFRPVVLRETDLGLQYGDDNAVISRFKNDLKRFSDSVLEPVRMEAQAGNLPKDWNAYGIAAAKLGSFDIAEAAFKKAIVMKSDFLSPRFNLGSLYYLTGDFPKALETFRDIEAQAESGRLSTKTLFDLYLNISRTCYELDRTGEAESYYRKAQELDPDKAASFSYINTGGNRARASEYPNAGIIFQE